MVSGPTHYRKFSNTTKMIMDQHKNGNDNGWKQTSSSKGHKARDSMKIGDIVDEHGIEYASEEEEEQQQRLERQSNDEKVMNRNAFCLICLLVIGYLMLMLHCFLFFF